MRLFDANVPYLFHTSLKGMEAGNDCGRREFHTFHTFHTCFSRVRIRAHMHTRALARLHYVNISILGMEGMEGMEEGRRRRVFSFHTSAIPSQGMEPRKESTWNN